MEPLHVMSLAALHQSRWSTKFRNCLKENVQRTRLQLICKEQRDLLFFLLQYDSELETYLDVSLLWPEHK